MKKSGIIVALLIGMGISAHAYKEPHEYDIWEHNYTVQALLGAMKYDDLEFELEDGQKETADISTIPQIGGAWATLPKGDRFQYGLETTFLFGFRTKDVDYLVISSGLHAKVSLSYWTIDFSGGPYINYYLDEAKRFRIYGAAGPLLMYADYDQEKDLSDDTSDDSSESAFGFGIYGRAGLEFRVYEKGMLGMGVRTVYADVDFSDVGGTTDVRGVAGFVTFTAGF